MLDSGLPVRVKGETGVQREFLLRGVSLHCATAVNRAFRQLAGVLAVVLAVVCNSVVRLLVKTVEV